MGTLIAVEYVSLDGVMEEPGWSAPYFNDEVASFQADNLAEADALLLGRVTYEGFSAAWPNMEAETGEFGAKMNTMPKHVVTVSRDMPVWNSTFISEGEPGAIVRAVNELKQQPGTLLLEGSADLFTLLTEYGVIDEYRLMVYPVIVGTGKKLWADGLTPRALSLTKSVITTSGVAILSYVPAPTA